MRSTYALVSEIWQRHRPVVAVIAGLTIAGRLLATPQPLIDVLAMLSFLLLFGVFNYGVPRRLFTLPVSSLRLVAVPLLTGIVAIELLYLLWMGLLSKGGSTSAPFVAVLLGALFVFYQTVLWTLERLGAMRLVVAGAVCAMVFAVGLLPPWLSESTLAALVAGAAIVAFLLAWRHVVSVRRGGGWKPLELERLLAMIPARRRPFASPMDAHFWFEWRCSGLALPVLAGGVVVAIIGPLSWLARDDAADTFRILLGTLATPIVLAIPVGMAFGKPAFWSEDLSVPPFVAVRPLHDEDIIAVKVKVAIASAVVSWLLVLAFVAIWLPLWGNLDAVSRFAIRLSAFRAALIVIAGMFLTWRFLVCDLWSGVSGRRALFIASVLSVVVVLIAGLAFDADRLPGWLLEDPARMVPVVWIAAIAVTAKYGLAAYSWRRVSARYARQYLLVWGAGTTCLLLLAMAPDISRFRSLMILMALLAVPLARVGLAPSYLGRNRHR